mgnify:CR=1 FL=1
MSGRRCISCINSIVCKLNYLKYHDVLAVFHYVPLHSAPGGNKFGAMHGEDVYTTLESERLVRLPLYFSLNEEQQLKVINCIKAFFSES